MNAQHVYKQRIDKNGSPSRKRVGLSKDMSLTGLGCDLLHIPNRQYDYRLQIPVTVCTPAMAAPTSAYKDRQFLAVIGDEVCI